MPKIKLNQINTTALVDLVIRMSDIDQEVQRKGYELVRLKEEYNAIIKEVWRRFPPLEHDPNIQLMEETKEEKEYVYRLRKNR